MKTQYPTTTLAIQLAAAVAMMTVFLPGPVRSEETNPSRPNIVLIYLFDLDADEVNCTADAIDTWPTPSGAQRVLGKAQKAGASKVHAAYQTAIVGKWHLKSTPTGFDHFEVLKGQGQ